MKRSPVTFLFLTGALLLGGCTGSETNAQEAPLEYAGTQDHIKLDDNLTIIQEGDELVIKTEEGKVSLTATELLKLGSATPGIIRSLLRRNLSDPIPMPCIPPELIAIAVPGGFLLNCPKPPPVEIELRRGPKQIENLLLKKEAIKVPGGFFVPVQR